MADELNALPKDFWLPNDCSKSCHKCEKSFSAIHRKHHCRYCGLIFCDKCAKSNLRLKSDVKLLRICDNCFSLVKSNTEVFRSYSLCMSFTNSFVSDLDDSLSIDENILDLAHELLPNKARALEVCSHLFLQKRCKELIEDKKLEEQWLDKIYKAAIDVIETVCPSAKFRQDDMNINKYVRIVKVPSQNSSCEFFSGGVVLRNIAHRKMLRSIENPKILFLDHEDEEFSLININSLISEEEQLNKIFVKKIESIAPKVVVCRKTLPENVIKKLAKRLITAIINVRDKEFYHLARITRGKVLKNINEACMLESFLGKCGKMELQAFEDKFFVCFTEVKDYTLGGTITVQSSDCKSISQVLKRVFIDFRNAKLERIFLLECGAQLSPDVLISHYSDSLKFKYLKVYKENICTPVSRLCISFYKFPDMCLGSFLTTLIQTGEDMCSYCKKPHKDHITYFIKSDKLVKLSMFKIKSINDTDIFLSTNCRECHKSISAHFLSNATWEYSLYKFLSNFFCSFSAEAKCGHSLFNNAFKFQLGTMLVLFSFEDYQAFQLKFPGNIQIKHEFNKELITESLNDTQISSKCVLDSILNQGKGIVIRINKEMAAVDNTYEQWLTLREQMLNLIENIYKIMREVFEPEASSFKTYLEVEAMRRGLFFECCNFKLAFSRVEQGIKKVRPLKKMISIASSNAASVAESSYLDPEFLMDEDLLLYFYKLQAGNLTLPLCAGCFVPVYETDIGSYIAYTLSSYQYQTEVLEKYDQNMENLLLTSKFAEWTHQANSYEQMDIKHSDSTKKLYGDCLSFSVTCYYPLQFQALRSAFGVELQNFIISISKTIYKSEELGKSAAIFKKTHDHLYIIKVIKEEEFRMFLSLAPNFFIHQCKSLFHNMPSILNTCLGAYKIAVKNITSGKSKTEYCLIFENIGNQLKGPVLNYDLKGTTNQKRKVKRGDKKTKMDLNFIEDFASLPLPINMNDRKFLEAAIINDTLFLSKQNIVDYSMLLVISMSEKRISMGIIDYLRHYAWGEVIENLGKKVVTAQEPTITNPDGYKKRFRTQVLSNYFMAIDD